MGYTKKSGESHITPTTNTPFWIYDSNYFYWTMSASEYNVSRDILIVNQGGTTSHLPVDYDNNGVVRLFVTLKKITEDNEENVEIEKEEDVNIKNEVTEDDNHKHNQNQIVSVPDTLLSRPIIFMVIGVVLITIGILMFTLLKIKNGCKKE